MEKLMKKFLVPICLLFCAMSFCFAQEKSYSIGDIGPGGGIVFYKDSSGFLVEDGNGGSSVCHYLEVSKEDLGCVTWSPKSDYLIKGSDRYGIGEGKVSTVEILRGSAAKLDSENSAAYLCSKYKTSTTKAGDWFLPTTDELRMLFKNLTLEKIGITNTEFYWSSSQEGFGKAWARKNKTSTIDSKSKRFMVRAVHAF